MSKPTPAQSGPIGQAVEQQRTAPPSPGQLVRTYESKFAAMIPVHMRAEQWIRVAAASLKKGKFDRNAGKYELEIAAENNPELFIAYLLEAARLGLEPGTKQYYLTPRWNGQTKRLEILGIVGWQGIVEMMFRGGRVSSVVVEEVYAGDEFTYRPGPGVVPEHVIDWDASPEDRGEFRLVYAYAVMTDGRPSKVVIVNAAYIDRIKADLKLNDYSPWVKWPESMRLKTAVKQLEKWVPTSAELLLPGGAAAGGHLATALAPARPAPGPALDAPSFPELGPIPDLADDDVRERAACPDSDDDRPVEGELVGDPDAGKAPTDAAPATVVDPPKGGVMLVVDGMPPRPAPPADGEELRTDAQSRALHKLLRDVMGVGGDDRFPSLSYMLGREITTTSEISKAECGWLIEILQAEAQGGKS